MTEIPPKLARLATWLSVPIAGRTWRIAAVQNQDTLIQQVQTDADLQRFPFGLMLWASAVGLAEFLTENPSLVRGKRVLEIGAGVGLVGLVAESLGAEVVQTDYHDEVLAFCRVNAAENGAKRLTIRAGDWRDWPEELTEFPVVLGSDVLYERTLHETLFHLLPRLVRENGVFLISDPLRPQALDFLERLEHAAIGTVEMQGRTVFFDSERKDIALHKILRTLP